MGKMGMAIPPTINGASSFTIGQRAFKSKGLAHVTIPNSVTSIGVYTFSLNQLVNITIIGGASRYTALIMKKLYLSLHSGEAGSEAVNEYMVRG